MGGGALLGDFVGGGAGAASFAMRAAMAEALPDDFGVFAAAFSFLAASSLAFALAIISATPIFGCARRRSEVLGHHPFYGYVVPRRRRSWGLLAALGVAQDHAFRPRLAVGPKIRHRPRLAELFARSS